MAVLWSGAARCWLISRLDAALTHQMMSDWQLHERKEEAPQHRQTPVQALAGNLRLELRLFTFNAEFVFMPANVTHTTGRSLKKAHCTFAAGVDTTSPFRVGYDNRTCNPFGGRSTN